MILSVRLAFEIEEVGARSKKLQLSDGRDKALG